MQPHRVFVFSPKTQRNAKAKTLTPFSGGRGSVNYIYTQVIPDWRALHTVNRRLGLPCATLGWPLGHAWATQGPPKPRPNRGRQRVASLASSQQLGASSFVKDRLRHNFSALERILIFTISSPLCQAKKSVKCRS
jgi:hypothetical protein